MLPPLKILVQQHMPDGKRLPKRVPFVEPIPMRQFGPAVRINDSWKRNCTHAKQTFNGYFWFCKDCGTRVADHQETLLPILNQRIVAARRPVGNIPWEDYRFFHGVRNRSSQFRRCRGCRKIFYGLNDMWKHIEATSCTVWLVESYKVLNRQKTALVDAFPKRECVMCGKEPTRRGIWGVPLCTSLTCLEHWMFDDDCPSATLTRALVATAPILQQRNRIHINAK